MSELKGKQWVKFKTTTQRMGEGGGRDYLLLALPFNVREVAGNKGAKSWTSCKSTAGAVKTRKRMFFASHTV
jgi:hypothetical protein